jgi:hypothetical protein
VKVTESVKVKRQAVRHGSGEVRVLIGCQPQGLHVEKPGSGILHIYAGTSMCKIQVSATIVPAAELERLVFVPDSPRKSPVQ